MYFDVDIHSLVEFVLIIFVGISGLIHRAEWMNTEEKIRRYGRFLPNSMIDEINKATDIHIVENVFALVTGVIAILWWCMS